MTRDKYPGVCKSEPRPGRGFLKEEMASRDERDRCPYCGSEPLTPEHMSSEHKCAWCEAAFAGKDLRRLHERLEHRRLRAPESRAPFWCSACPSCYRTLGALAEHVSTVHHDYSCFRCVFPTKDRDEYIRHVLAAHLGDQGVPEGEHRWKCSMCYYGTPYMAQLGRHIVNEHHNGCGSMSPQNDPYADYVDWTPGMDYPVRLGEIRSLLEFKSEALDAVDCRLELWQAIQGALVEGGVRDNCRIDDEYELDRPAAEGGSNGSGAAKGGNGGHGRLKTVPTAGETSKKKGRTTTAAIGSKRRIPKSGDDDKEDSDQVASNSKKKRRRPQDGGSQQQQQQQQQLQSQPELTADALIAPNAQSSPGSTAYTHTPTPGPGSGAATPQPGGAAANASTPTSQAVTYPFGHGELAGFGYKNPGMPVNTQPPTQFRLPMPSNHMMMFPPSASAVLMGPVRNSYGYPSIPGMGSSQAQQQQQQQQSMYFPATMNPNQPWYGGDQSSSAGHYDNL